MNTVPRWIDSCRALVFGSIATACLAQVPATPPTPAPETPATPTATPARAATPATPTGEYVKAHYTKYEFRIPMRDGKRLFTSVYVPKDDEKPWPFMMDRTPYNVGPYGEDKYKTALGPSDEFEKAGYIFVYQDVRVAT